MDLPAMNERRYVILTTQKSCSTKTGPQIAEAPPKRRMLKVGGQRNEEWRSCSGMMSSQNVHAAKPGSYESIKPNLAAADLTCPGQPARLRVCLITTEFHGLFKNGGIGTANTGLALALSQAGFDVTVAFADADENGPRVKEGNFTELKVTYCQLGITLDFVPASPVVPKAFDDPRSASYCVYLYLKQHEFDVVYFNDCGGHGYYALQAKRMGVFRNPPRMYVVAHGPQEWVLELNSIPYWDRSPVITAYLERRSAALADALISPSQYLVDWMGSHSWAMPAEVLVIQNIVRLPDSMVRSAWGSKSPAISEIVFFGRLEVRKGLELFCDAMDQLNQSANLSGIRITFMGKFSHVAGLHSGMYVVERARRWRSSLRILAKYGQEEALAYLNQAGMLAVIPSLAENSPCVVAECLQLGVPFIATDRGGTVELVAPEDRHLCLVVPDPRALAKRLDQILKSGHQPTRLASSQADTLSQWLRLTKSCVTECGDRAVSSSSAPRADGQRNGAAVLPLVSVCLGHSSLSPGAEALIESVLRQSYPRLEILLVGHGSGDESQVPVLADLESARDRITLRVLPGTPGDRGTERNALAAQACGEYLLFVEENTVILMPECIEALVAAALRTGADIITGVPLQFLHGSRPADGRDGKLSYFPIGACAELGGFENCFGDGTFLVDRRGFERCGGFQTPCNPEIEDWLFLATSVLSGLHLEVVPEPLFWYKVQRPAELNRSRSLDNHRRILDAYSGQKIQLFSHIIETMVNAGGANSEKLREGLGGMSGAAREIALRVSSSFEPNNEDAFRGLVQFCLERHKTQEALDFALHNGPSILSEAISSAKLVAETLALDAVRGHTLDLLHEVGLTEEVKQRVKCVSAFPAGDFVQPCGGVAAHSIETGVTALKAAAVCPPGTRSVRAVAIVDASAPSGVSLAFVVSTPKARLRLSEQALASDEAFWWSGWISAAEGGGRLQLSVPVLEPGEQLLDLHFLCKTDEHGTHPEGKVTWESVSATISVNGTITASAVESAVVATPIPRQVLDQGLLLTQNSDFPFPLFVPGEATLLHPLPGRAVLVRVPGAVPCGTKGVRSVVSLQNAEAHPVQFAAWVRASSAPATTETEFTVADAFSGWFLVRDKFRRHSFTVTLGEPAKEAMDLYLATRVVGYPDVHYCHSVWHELLLLQ
jgi:glycosyltransferase involved in cell wall biosynthesis